MHYTSGLESHTHMYRSRYVRIHYIKNKNKTFKKCLSTSLPSIIGLLMSWNFLKSSHSDEIRMQHTYKLRITHSKPSRVIECMSYLMRTLYKINGATEVNNA